MLYNTELLPENKSGKKVDLTADITCTTPDAALERFELACKRLLSPFLWQKLCGLGSPVFELVTDKCEPITRLARQGDYIRIDIPGPGPSAGEGYDWVQVSTLEDHRENAGDEKYLGMKLTPCASPIKDGSEIAHFFDSEASSSFIVRIENNTVTVDYYGRNEKINNHTDSIIDNVRNTTMGLGAQAGLSELQWSVLIRAFLKQDAE
jgi:hypothetical protein